MPLLVDTHTHIYQPPFSQDLDLVVQRARAEGVEKCYLPGIDSTVIDALLRVEALYPGTCFAMMGLHPCSVNADYEQELGQVRDWLARRPFAAVGEIGLDFYWDKTFEQQQNEAFRAQIELAIRYNLPIVIHTRNAMAQTIAVVREYVPRGVRGIFHCFGDSYEFAREIVDNGFYLGIGGVLTYKKSGLVEVLPRIGLSSLVLETDAPYLTPVPFRGKRNEPSYLKHIATRLAEVMGVSVDEVGEVTTANAEKVFGS